MTHMLELRLLAARARRIQKISIQEAEDRNQH